VQGRLGESAGSFVGSFRAEETTEVHQGAGSKGALPDALTDIDRFCEDLNGLGQAIQFHLDLTEIEEYAGLADAVAGASDYLQRLPKQHVGPLRPSGHTLEIG
jgi:hypothetical protein